MIFFHNVGVLNRCGHGTIGLLVTLAHLGRIGLGTHKIETPVGVVEATLHGPNDVTIRNVPSYRFAKDVPVEVEKYGAVYVEKHGPVGGVLGDIAWGGNWFFLVKHHPFEINLANLERLTDFTVKIREGLERQEITGENGAEIDHIELFGPSEIANSKNFVLCPSGRLRPVPSAGTRTATPSSRAWRPTASSRKARSGGRKASSAASSRGS